MQNCCPQKFLILQGSPPFSSALMAGKAENAVQFPVRGRGVSRVRDMASLLAGKFRS